ncbi:hypothetical protein DFH09DRAFT_1178955 [Mycena vulgaris]|nr:hypothetical protein DFH09DRAFT_1178955 [Mycena vulgaris]
MTKESTSGYESDTGERDNPTCWHFENKRPVTKTIVVQLGHHVRLLNRQGRAICRIMDGHGWSIVHLAAIFGLSQNPIMRAVANTYAPPDKVSEDYNHVDPEFKVKFPPLKRENRPEAPPTVIEILDSDDETDTKAGILSAGSGDSIEGNASSKTFRSGRPMRTATTQFLARMRDSDDLDEFEEPLNNVGTSQSQVHGAGVTQTTTVKTGPSFAPGTSSAARKRPHGEDAGPSTLNHPSTTSDSVSGSLAAKKPRHAPLPPPEDSSVGSARPRQSQTSTAVPSSSPNQSPPTRRLPLPNLPGPAFPLPLPRRASVPTLPAPSAAHPDLDAFLRNVTGIDLSAHRALFLAQGFTMGMLRIVGAWMPVDRTRTLNELLLDGGSALNGRKGLSPLQVMALKLAIEELARRE